MGPEEIFIARIENALNNGHFPPIEDTEEGSVLVVHQKECTVSENDVNGSSCNCIPDLIVSFKGQIFSIDQEGIDSNHVMI